MMLLASTEKLMGLETALFACGVLLIAMGLYLAVSGRELPGLQSLGTLSAADPHASERLRWLGGAAVLFGVASLLLGGSGPQIVIATISLLFALGGCVMFLAALQRFGRWPGRLNKRGWLFGGLLIVFVASGSWLLSYYHLI